MMMFFCFILHPSKTNGPPLANTACSMNRLTRG
jgi:hypothetical protein